MITDDYLIVPCTPLKAGCFMENFGKSDKSIILSKVDFVKKYSKENV